MAGYDNFSMSNNARAAYASGEAPFSKLPARIRRLGRQTLEYYVKPSSYHHTSAKYNCTDFYRIEEVNAVFGLTETSDYTFESYLNEDAVRALREFENAKKGVPPWRWIVVDGDYHEEKSEAEAIAAARSGKEAYRRYLERPKKGFSRWHTQHLDANGALLDEEVK